ncbi:MAG: hypothetical protein AAFQ59_00930 [Pseudomonadota bacterium]
MLIFTLMLIALTALAFAFPWVRHRQHPPKLLLWIAVLALALVAVLIGVPVDNIVKLLPR